MKRHHRDWDEMAARAPYFAVLTDDRFLGELDPRRRAQFFDSGEEDVRELLRIAARFHGDVRLERVLDFGCGVGRLVLPFARRSGEVVGFDVSPRMLEEARRNAAESEITNAQFAGDLDQLEGRFDFICSLIVFQHIPVSEGMASLRTLLRLLAPGGIAALHFSLRRPGSWWRRAARRIRAASPLLHRIVSRLRHGSTDLPYMQMNTYDAAAIARVFREELGTDPEIVPRNQGEIEGALFIAQRPC